MESTQQELLIGEVYRFNYTNTTPKQKKEATIRCRLNDKQKQKLISELQENSKEIMKSFEAKQKAMKDYLSAVSKLETLKAERHEKGKYARKSDEEKKLEKIIADGKKEFFPKKKNKSQVQKTRDLFIRYYHPKSVQLTNDNGIEAVYAGMQISPTGKVIHKWYNLSATHVPGWIVNINHVDILE